MPRKGQHTVYPHTLRAVATLLQGGLTERETAEALALPLGSIPRLKRYLRDAGMTGWRCGTPRFPRRYTPDMIRAVQACYASGMAPRQIQARYGIPAGTFHRLLHIETGVPVRIRPVGRPRRAEGVAA